MKSNSMRLLSAFGMAICFFVALMMVLNLSGCGGGGSSASLTSITVTPADKSIAPGTTVQFSATGNYSDASHRDLSASAIWSSSDNGIATISNSAGSNGLATAVAAGSVTITATFGDVSDSATFTPAALASITVTPADTTIIILGVPQQFMATGVLSNNSTQDLTNLAAWSSLDESIVIVDSGISSYGLAYAIGEGSATIRATFAGIFGSTTVNAHW